MNINSPRTKIVCTIGPASESPEVMKQMIEAGMNVARLNFSHGDFAAHKKVIENLRAASASLGRRIAIMADLSGPKMRIGSVAPEPIELKAGDTFMLTTDEVRWRARPRVRLLCRPPAVGETRETHSFSMTDTSS